MANPAKSRDFTLFHWHWPFCYFIYWHIFFINTTELHIWISTYQNIFSLTTQITFIMLRWSVTFLVIAIVAAIFGFGGIAAGAAGFAKILFVLALIVFVITLVAGRGGRARL